MEVEPYDETKDQGDWLFRSNTRRKIVNWWYAHNKMQGTRELHARASEVYNVMTRPDPYPVGPVKVCAYTRQQMGDPIELGGRLYPFRTLLDMAIADIRTYTQSA